jgi:hypothetical protein
VNSFGDQHLAKEARQKIDCLNQHQIAQRPVSATTFVQHQDLKRLALKISTAGALSF